MIDRISGPLITQNASKSADRDKEEFIYLRHSLAHCLPVCLSDCLPAYLPT